MRVKIAYTVELEEVEKEVSEIMSRAADDLDDAYQEVVKIQTELETSAEQSHNHAKHIEAIRLKMFTADQILQDCQLILEGYHKAKEQMKELENEVQDG